MVPVERAVAVVGATRCAGRLCLVGDCMVAQCPRCLTCAGFFVILDKI